MTELQPGDLKEDRPSALAQARGRVRSGPNGWEIEIAVGLTLMWSALRIRAPQNLAPSSLYLDDAWVGLAARLPLSDVPRSGLAAPGYSLMLGLLTSILGKHEWVLQLPALVFGVLGPYLIYLFYRRLAHPVGALTAALVLVWAPISVDYSTRVKQYTFDIVAGAAILLVAAWVADDTSQPRRWWTFTFLAAFFVVMSGGVLVVVAGAGTALAILVLCRFRADLWIATKSGLALAGVLGLYFVAFLRDVLQPNLVAYWDDFYLSFDDGVTQFASDLWGLFELFLAGFLVVGHPVWVALIMLVFCVLVWARNPVFLGFAVLPVVLAVGLSIADRAPFGGGRPDSALYAPMLLLVGVGVGEAIEWAERYSGRLRNTALSGVVVGLALFFHATQRNEQPALAYPIEDLSPAVEVLESLRAPSDVTLVYYPTIYAYAFYSDGGVSIPDDANERNSRSPFGLDFAASGVIQMREHRADPERYRAYVTEAAEADGTVWFVASHAYQDEVDDIATMIADTGRILGDESRTYRDAWLQEWIVDPATG